MGRRHPETGLGVLAMEQGWLTASQLLDALAEQAQEANERGRARPIGDILVSRGSLTREQVAKILELQGPAREARKKSAPASEPKPPTRSFGPYRIVKRIGQGTTGVVYEAVDSRRESPVALKIFHLYDSDDPWTRRFEREAGILKALPPHPHVVKVLDSGVLDGRSYLAMELVDGPDLTGWLKASHPLRERVMLLRDVALAVHHAHENGILHRDLKPWNVLVDREGRPKLADFGLARQEELSDSEVITRTVMLLGTPAYMSPEQARGAGRIDRTADVYSLGMMLYEMLTGRTPYGGKATVVTLLRIVQEPIPPPSRIAAEGVDADLEAACVKALAKKPGDRHPTARALADALSAWLKR